MAPQYFNEMYYPVVQGYESRSSFQKLNIPFKTTNRGQKSLSYLGPKMWNGLNRELKMSTSVNNFKHKLKSNFFAQLQIKEDSPNIYY